MSALPQRIPNTVIRRLSDKIFPDTGDFRILLKSVFKEMDQ